MEMDSHEPEDVAMEENVENVSQEIEDGNAQDAEDNTEESNGNTQGSSQGVEGNTQGDGENAQGADGNEQGEEDAGKSEDFERSKNQWNAVEEIRTPEQLLKERTEKGIQITGLPLGYNRSELRTYVKSFGQIVEKVEPMTRNTSRTKNKDKTFFSLFRFKDQESAIKMKETAVHELSFGKINVSGWFDGRPIQEKVVPKNIANKILPRAIEFDTNLSFDRQLEALLLKILPATATLSKYNHVCNDVRVVVNRALPNCLIQPFGSTMTGLALESSDVDIFIDARNPAIMPERSIRIIKQHIYTARHLFQCPIMISAKTPIVRFFHKKTGLKCDISTKNSLGVMNSQLIKYYVDLDPRVKLFLLLIRYWSKYYGLTGTTNQMSNYALTWKVLFYLQQMEHPLIPTVAYLKDKCEKKIFVEKWDASFAPVPWKMSPEADSLTIVDLLRGYFNYYAKFNYAEHVMCPLLGKIVTKAELEDPATGPKEMALFFANCQPEDLKKFGNETSICVQDPIVLAHNVTKGLRRSYLFDIMLPNYRKAADICSEVTNKDLLLSKLFDEKNRNATMPCVDLSQLKFNVKLLPTQIAGFECASLVGDALYSWFEDSFKFIVYMLENLFSLEIHDIVTYSESGESPCKRSRLDSEGIRQSEAAKPMTFLCSGCYDIMDSRNVFRKKVTEVMSPLKKELLLTEQVLAQLKLQEATCTTIDFTCKVTPVLKPPQIIVEIDNRGTKEKKFRKWSLFLDENIYKWYYAFFVDYRHSILKVEKADRY